VLIGVHSWLINACRLRVAGMINRGAGTPEAGNLPAGVPGERRMSMTGNSDVSAPLSVMVFEMVKPSVFPREHH
jgi:hypothetical protein